jgi:hypothetical protein
MFEEHVTAQFRGYTFAFGDMDFLRMAANYVLFGVILILVLLVLKYLTSTNFAIRIWLVRLFFDVVEMPIWFAYWSSLVFTFQNASSSDLKFLLVHLSSYVLIGLLLWRQYRRYRMIKKIELNFIGVLVSTLLLVLAHLLPLLFLLLLSMFTILMVPINVVTHSKERMQVSSLAQTARSARSILAASMPLWSVILVILFCIPDETIDSEAVVGVSLAMFYLLLVLVVSLSIFIKKQRRRRPLEDIQSVESANTKIIGGAENRWNKSLYSNLNPNATC